MKIYYLTVLEARRLQVVFVGLSQGVSRATYTWRLKRKICVLDFSSFWRLTLCLSSSPQPLLVSLQPLAFNAISSFLFSIKFPSFFFLSGHYGNI